MTQRFNDFMTAIKSIEKKRQAVTEDISRITEELSAAEESYSIAEITGDPTKALEQTIEGLKNELQRAHKKLDALSKDPSLIAKVLHGSPSTIAIAQEIYDANTGSVQELQNAYDAKSRELEELKTMFLKTVAKMGRIKAEASDYAREINQVVRYIPGKESSRTFGIAESFSRAKREGSIYIGASESEKTYDGHRVYR